MLSKSFIEDIFNKIIDKCNKHNIPYKVINWTNGDINGIRINNDWYLYTCDEKGYEYSNEPTHFLLLYYDLEEDNIVNNIITYEESKEIIKNMHLK